MDEPTADRLVPIDASTPLNPGGHVRDRYTGEEAVLERRKTADELSEFVLPGWWTDAAARLGLADEVLIDRWSLVVDEPTDERPTHPPAVDELGDAPTHACPANVTWGPCQRLLSGLGVCNDVCLEFEAARPSTPTGPASGPPLPEHATVTEYRFSMLTEADTVDYFVWDIHVQWRGGDRWAVTRGGSIVLSADGEWTVEEARFIDSPTEREAWLAEHRFDLATALAMAEAELPRMRINGLTALDILARSAHPTGERDER